MIVHTSSDTQVHRLVLRIAAEASALAKYGSPPLKPFQPSHRIPAPTIAISRLLGGKWSRSCWIRGPITAAATKPDVPAARWITYPPEKSAAPKVASHPPPQMLKHPTV